MLVGLFVVLLAAEACAEAYRYKDADGVIHFTDNYIEIPENQRWKVETVFDWEESATPVVQTAVDAPEDTPAAEDPVANQQPPEQAGTRRPEAEAAEGAPAQEQLEALVKIKVNLDNIYNSLASERVSLEKEQETIITLESMRAFQEKANIFNKKLADYERQRQAFQVRADAYNSAVDKQ